MKNLILAYLILLSIGARAQNASKVQVDQEIASLDKKEKSIETENRKLEAELKAVNAALKTEVGRVKTLQSKIDSNKLAIDKANSELGSKISTSESNSNEKISAVNQSLSIKSLYGIIAILLAILISGVLYLIISKRQKVDKSDLIDELSKTKLSIEESLVKEFGKQTNLMDAQLQLLEQQKQTMPTSSKVDPDHSLPLKVASEINLIERNVRLMDPKTKGIKQLTASVGKLKDNLVANGYEIIELLGKPFHQGMKVIVISSIPDENLEKDAEIISKVLIPQVNYNDKMIQTAQIEVAVGY